MDRKSLLAYRRRWQAVEEIEDQEARTDSLDLRLKQLCSLVGMARALGIMPEEDRDEEVVRARWLRLKGLQ